MNSNKSLTTKKLVTAALLAALTVVLWEPILDALPIDQSKWLGVDGNLYHIGEKGDRGETGATIQKVEYDELGRKYKK